MKRPKNIKPMDREYWEWMDSGTDLPMFLWVEVRDGKLTDEQAHEQQQRILANESEITS